MIQKRWLQPLTQGGPINLTRRAASPKAISESVSNLLKSAEEQERKGDWEGALNSYQSALDQSRSINEPKLEALALRGASRANFQMGRLDEAMGFVEKAIETNRSMKNAKGRSLDLILAGQISIAQGNYPKAVSQLEESQKILPLSESAALPGLLQDLAKAYIKSQRFQEALSVLNRLGAFYSKNNNTEQLARIRINVSDILLIQG